MKILDTLSSIFRFTIFSGSLFQVGWTIWPPLIHKERYLILLTSKKKNYLAPSSFTGSFAEPLFMITLLAVSQHRKRYWVQDIHHFAKTIRSVLIELADSKLEVLQIWSSSDGKLKPVYNSVHLMYTTSIKLKTSLQGYLTKFSFFLVSFIIDKNVGRDCHKCRRIKS